jgi:hypothetical protein
MKNQPFSLKTFIILALSTCYSSNIFSQSYDREYYSANKDVSIYTSEFQKGKTSISNYILKYNADVLSENLSRYDYRVDFSIDQKAIITLDSLVQMLGYVTRSNQTNNNNKLKIKNLQNQIEDYQIQINRIRERSRRDSTAQQRNSTETSINYNEDKIKEANRKLSQIKENETKVFVSINLNDELSVPSGNSKITWAKMPGVAYNYLMVENPKVGTSDKSYAGMNLKYIFTKGKSFFQIGVLKSQNLSDVQQYDSLLSPNTINEFFTVEFGQDFYTKHFGRGNRKFLNLYSGYTIGGMIPNKRNDDNLGFIPVLNLSIGVEIIKTKHILLDARGSYFLPLDGINRNTRGILLGTSFNFVF